MSAHLILYGRSYCHLCEDMQLALNPFAALFDFTLDIVDVDSDPELVALYDELVPVLVARQADGSQRQLCHYFLDPAAMHGFFAEPRV
jgi:hypothetical protein